MPNAMFSLEGKSAVVTGGASGMGEAITKRFVAAGANVLVADLGDQSEKVNAWGASYKETDVSDQKTVEAALDKAIELFGKLDILVNNAGIAMYRELKDIEPAKANTIFQVNALGVLYGMAAAATRMKGGGSIINTSSSSSISGAAGLTEYSATKGAVSAATRSAALELGARNIRVNAVNPGSTATPMSVQQRSKISRSAPMITALGRQGTPDEIAAVVHFLASDDAGYVTGHIINVDGGWTAGTTPQIFEAGAAANP